MKKTQVEMFNEIMEVNADNEEIVNFCKERIEQLNKRKHSSKPTKKQIENEALKEKIVGILASAEEPITIDAIKSADEEMGTFSNQKISALLTLLKKDGLVVRTEKKRVAYFGLA